MSATDKKIGKFFDEIRRHAPTSLLAINNQNEIAFVFGAFFETLCPQPTIGAKFRDFRFLIPIEPTHVAMARGGESFQVFAKRGDAIFETHYWPMKIDGEEYIFCQFVDCSVRLEAEVETETIRATIDAEKRVQSLDRAMGGVAHEINNPLMVISGIVQLMSNELARENPGGKTFSDKLTKIREYIDRISSITHCLEPSGKEFIDTIKSGGVRLETVVEAVKGQFALALRDKDITTTVILEPREVSVSCNAEDLEQALNKLVANAIDACMEEENPAIDICAIVKRDMVEIRVTNNGPVIPSRLRNQIMQPFFSTKGMAVGRGLGLTIARDLIVSNRGTLKLDEKSERTTFVIELPVVQHQVA